MRFTHSLRTVLLFAAYSLGAPSWAQAPDTRIVPPIVAETPESVAARYMDAMKRGDWKSCAALMHPDALKQLKQLFRPIAFSSPQIELGTMFFNVRTAAEYDRLSGAQAYERLMGAITKMNPEVGSAIATSQYEIIGHVPEGSDTAHVVYRMKATTQGISVTKLTVMPLKKSGATWGGLLTGDIEGMAAALSRMAKPQPTSKGPVKKAPAKPTAKPQRK